MFRTTLRQIQVYSLGEPFSRFNQLVGHLQVFAGLKAECEALVHTMNTILSDEITNPVLLTDAKNTSVLLVENPEKLYSLLLQRFFFQIAISVHPDYL